MLVLGPTSWVGIAIIGVVVGLIYSLRLRTEVRTDGVYLKMWPLHRTFRRISWSDVERYESKQYSPLREFGGWGIRLRPGKIAYNVSGNQGVWIERTNGRAVLVGSHHVEEFVNYLVSTNTGEVLVVFLGVLLGSLLFPAQFSGTSQALILTPILILWINLVADTLPALALGADPHADGLMDRPPRPTDEGVINARVLVSILTIAVLLAVTGLGMFFYTLDRTGSLLRAQSLLFTFIVVVELIRIQVIRSRYDQTLRSNLWLVGAIGVSLLVQFAVLYTPLHDFFQVVPLTLVEWGWIAVGFIVFLLLNVVVSALNSRIFESRISE